MNQIRKIRILLSESSFESEVITRQRVTFDRAQRLVRVFYFANVAWAIWWSVQYISSPPPGSFDPLWPLAWASSLNTELIVPLVLIANCLLAVLACGFSRHRVARAAAALGVLQTVALFNSFGHVGHSCHLWVWTSISFVFLPDGTSRQFANSRVDRQIYLQVFWFTQFAILFFYSMAGGLKVVASTIQVWQGEVGGFAPEGLARHIASRLMQTNMEPPLGRFLIENIWLSYPLFLGAIALETTSVFVAFRPSLHRIWGISLILFHMGIGLAMGIWFAPSIVILAVLFLKSPFENFNLERTVGQLPGLAGLIQSSYKNQESKEAKHAITV